MAELHHGGRLHEVATRYGIPLSQWLDLSTGINPNGWPVPQLPTSCWQRLPEREDGLESAAAVYYGSRELLPVAGSQAAIQLLPRMRRPGRVGMLQPSYAEHALAWQRVGHEVLPLSAETVDSQLDRLDVLLLVNPNNPGAQTFQREQLAEWLQCLRQRGGWLVLDEAFIDTEPGQSMVPVCGDEGLVVLRSLGKFFGLAGLRVGFVFAWPLLLKQMARELGPWHVSGPAREVSRQALLDYPWQEDTRQRLRRDGQRLERLLQASGLHGGVGTALFHYVPHSQAAVLHHAMASQGVFTRLFEHPPALRFGLPADETQWDKLGRVLASLQLMQENDSSGVTCPVSG